MLRFFIKAITRNNSPRWLVLLIDLYIVVNTFIASYIIRFNFSLDFDTSQLSMQIPVIVLAALIGFILIGSYKGIIRHTGFRDAMNVMVASLVIMFILIAIVIINRKILISDSFTIPISIIAIHFLLNTVILISSRYIFKSLYYLVVSDLKYEKRVLIYGAGEAGLLTYAVLKDDKANKIKIVGFIDDNKSKDGKKINGVNVYHSSRISKELIEGKNIDEIVLSIQRIRSSRLLEIVDKLAEFDVLVKIVPPAESWINNNLKANQIKAVKIEDLLGRAPIELNNPTIQNEIEGNVVFITGAAGSIGSEISRQVSRVKCKNLILIDQAESELYNLQQYFSQKGITNIQAIVADVRNTWRMRSLFEKYQPDLVFHAAAYKHVPFMEQNPYEAVLVNVAGTKNIGDLSVEFEVSKFVMISTDKAVNPTNVMGATKRIAEMYINSINNYGNTKFITTRFGNVLGSNGSVIPLFQRQIEVGGPLTVTHKDITRFFMTIPEACQLVLEAGAMGQGGEIFVFDMGKSMKIYDLAQNMIHLSGLKFPDDIDIQITGLRPGEKIYEELLGDGENTIPTHHNKIMIAKVKATDKVAVNKKIQELCMSNLNLNFKETVMKMKEIVPEFISNNSEYECLDESVKISHS